MTIDEFQKRLSGIQHLTVIGPLARRLPDVLSDPTVYVDGGCLIRPPSRTRDLSVGDGDSSATEKMDLLLPVEKDVSDLGFVLQHLPACIANMELSGFFGQRLDHQLANLGVIHERLMKNPARITFDETRTGWGLPAHSEVTLSIRGPFSIFSLQPGLVRMVGKIRYELSDVTPLGPLSSHGLSNEGFGEFQVKTDTPVFVLMSDPD